MNAPPKLEYITKCSVPGCTKEFVSYAFSVPIIGQPDKRLMDFVEAMGKHVKNAHPEQMIQILGSAEQLKALMLAATFDIRDPQLLTIKNAIRWALHQFTAPLAITDEHIAARVAALELEPEQREGITDLLKDMRDLLTESGRYAPQVTEKQIVTA